MSSIRHLFFDNDGTIVDSEILAIRSMLRHLEPHGFVMDERTYAMQFPGLLERDILHILERDFQVKVPHDFLVGLHDEHVAMFEHELEIIAGMDHLFRNLKVPKSMVSNASVMHVERCLRKVGLFDDFKGHIFSANHVERPKPFPDVYLYAIEQAGVRPEEVLVIEDSPTGVTAAKSAGLKVVGFLGASHIADGHGDILWERGADYVVGDAGSLEKLLLELIAD